MAIVPAKPCGAVINGDRAKFVVKNGALGSRNGRGGTVLQGVRVPAINGKLKVMIDLGESGTSRPY